jgi:hypothetical protein
MNIIKRPNRSAGSFSEDGIYVILPMLDETYLDSIFRISDNTLCWKFELSNSSYGNHFIEVRDGTMGTTPSTKDFLREIESYYPEDLEFFIWHPELFEGSFYGEHHDTDTVSPIDPSVLLVGLSVGQNTGA